MAQAIVGPTTSPASIAPDIAERVRKFQSIKEPSPELKQAFDAFMNTQPPAVRSHFGFSTTPAVPSMSGSFGEGRKIPTPGSTLVDEVVGGSKQFIQGIQAAANPIQDPMGAAGGLIGPLRVVNSLTEELAMDAGSLAQIGTQYAMEAAGLEEAEAGTSLIQRSQRPGIASNVGRGTSVGSAFMIPGTVGPNLARGTAMLVMRPVSRFMGGQVGVTERLMARAARRQHSAVATVEEFAERRGEFGKFFSAAEDAAGKQARASVSRKIEPALDSMRGVRPAESTRTRVEELLTTIFREKGLPIPPDNKLARMLKTLREPATDDDLFRKAVASANADLLEEVGLAPLSLEGLTRNLSAREMDDMRHLVTNALVKAKAAGDDNTARIMGGVLEGIRSDIARFADQFPAQVRAYTNGYKQYVDEVVPFFVKGAKARKLAALGDGPFDSPSQIVDQILRATPEDVGRIGRSFSRNPEARNRTFDAMIDGIVEKSINNNIGVLDVQKLTTMLDGNMMLRLKLLDPVRFRGVQKLRDAFQKSERIYISFPRRPGMMSATAGIRAVTAGVIGARPSRVLQGVMMMVSPQRFARFIQTQSGMEIISNLLVADRLSTISRRGQQLFNAINAIKIESGVESPQEAVDLGKELGKRTFESVKRLTER